MTEARVIEPDGITAVLIDIDVCLDTSCWREVLGMSMGERQHELERQR